MSAVLKKYLIFIAALLGLLGGFMGAYLFAIERHPQPPAFKPAQSPYPSAIFANGIVEGSQDSGANINLFPEVSAPVRQVLVRDGQRVAAGTALLQLDDTVQQASTEQLRLQAEAAQALLRQLKAQPRPETLAIARAQLSQAEAALQAARDSYDKRQRTFDTDARAISRDVLDSARHALAQAEAAREVAARQLALTEAGAWQYDIANQDKQAQAAQQAYVAARAQLAKYTLRAPVDGVVLAVNAARGGNATSAGSYNPYTQSNDPVVVMSGPQDTLAVRCFIDEILIARLPRPEQIRAEMSIRGTEQKVALSFDRVLPLVSPKIQLSNQRQEKVDLRVLPVLFRFQRKDAPVIYPGQLVDVYIGSRAP